VLLGPRLITDSHNRWRQICDLGCGTGGNLRFLAAWGDVLGVEQDKEVAFRVRHESGLRILSVEAKATGLGTSVFHLVTAFDLLEHCEDDRAVCREAYRILQPDGRFVVTVPAHPWLWGRQDTISHHLRRYTPSQLRVLLRSVGFTLERATAFNSWFFPLVAAVRLWRRFVKDQSTESDFAMTTPGFWNEVAYQIMRTEAWVLQYMNLPEGVSYAVVARKPA